MIAVRGFVGVRGVVMLSDHQPFVSDSDETSID